jgi:hypothetical protein
MLSRIKENETFLLMQASLYSEQVRKRTAMAVRMWGGIIYQNVM